MVIFYRIPFSRNTIEKKRIPLSRKYYSRFSWIKTSREIVEKKTFRENVPKLTVGTRFPIEKRLTGALKKKVLVIVKLKCVGTLRIRKLLSKGRPDNSTGEKT